MAKNETLIVQRLLSIQEKQALTDTSLSSQLGISRSLWWLIKTGQRKPGMKFLQAVIQVYPELTQDCINVLTNAGVG